MIYSELIATALHELNMSKKAFAKEMGISVTTLYRILNSESCLPSSALLKKLERKGIDISALNYDEIYYDFVSDKLADFRWEEDIFEGKVALRHKSCGKCIRLTLDELENYKSVKCPYCASTYDNESKTTNLSNTSDRPKTSYICDAFGSKIFKLTGPKIVQFYKSTKYNVVIVPDGVTEIGPKVFDAYFDLREIKLPNSLRTVHREAFSLCFGLRELLIPEGVEEIQANAFAHCSNLRRVHISSTLLNIDETAFGTGFSSLAKAYVEIDPNNKRYKIIGNCFVDMFTNTVLGCVNMKYETKLVIPDGIKRISSCAAMGLLDLQCVSFPSSLEYIGSCAFYECTNLNQICIPANVNEIGEFAFSRCINVESLNIDVENIRFANIRGCIVDLSKRHLIQGFKFSRIPSDGSVITICRKAFDRVKKDSSLFIPATIKNIEDNAFSGEFNISCEPTDRPDGWNVKWNNDHKGQICWGKKIK